MYTSLQQALVAAGAVSHELADSLSSCISGGVATGDWFVERCDSGYLEVEGLVEARDTKLGGECH